MAIQRYLLRFWLFLSQTLAQLTLFLTTRRNVTGLALVSVLGLLVFGVSVVHLSSLQAFGVSALHCIHTLPFEAPFP